MLRLVTTAMNAFLISSIVAEFLLCLTSCPVLRKSDFLKTGQEVKHSKNSATMEEIKKAFMAVVTSLNKALTENHVLH